MRRLTHSHPRLVPCCPMLVPSCPRYLCCHLSLKKKCLEYLPIQFPTTRMQGPIGTCGRDLASIAPSRNRSPGSCGDSRPVAKHVRWVERQFRAASSRPPSASVHCQWGTWPELLPLVGHCGWDPAAIAPGQNRSPGSREGPPPVTL